MHDISRSKDNQTMEFHQLIENNVEMFFFENHAEIEAGKLFPDLFLNFFLKKALLEAKASGHNNSFHMFW